MENPGMVARYAHMNVDGVRGFMGKIAEGLALAKAWECAPWPRLRMPGKGPGSLLTAFSWSRNVFQVWLKTH